MVKITKRTVDAAEPATKDYVIWDDELPGFGLRVFPSGKRSYIIQYRVRGRSRRYSIGQHGVWTPETARREAKVRLGCSVPAKLGHPLLEFSGPEALAGRGAEKHEGKQVHRRPEGVHPEAG